MNMLTRLICWHSNLHGAVGQLMSPCLLIRTTL